MGFICHDGLWWSLRVYGLTPRERGLGEGWWGAQAGRQRGGREGY